MDLQHPHKKVRLVGVLLHTQDGGGAAGERSMQIFEAHWSGSLAKSMSCSFSVSPCLKNKGGKKPDAHTLTSSVLTHSAGVCARTHAYSTGVCACVSPH